MYKVFRDCLFWFDAEKVHEFTMASLQTACSTLAGRSWLKNAFHYRRTDQQKHLFGLSFRNPVGLGAGFDKNARYLRELDCLGFGFIEIGTVTPRPQEGNERPRLFRLKSDRALVNRMGFNNLGVAEAVRQLRRWKKDYGQSASRMIVGGNIGKNKSTPNEDAWQDYETCFKALFDYVDYFVINVSSPNTPGLRELQEKPALQRIVSHLQAINQTMPRPKPLLLKIAPDLTESQLDDIVDLARETGLSGLVATNTTLDRNSLSAAGKTLAESAGAGGLSGAPLREKSTAVVRYLHHRSGGLIPIIASGGIFTAEDANEKLVAGASLIQVWTGFIFEGPGIVKKICSGLTTSNGS